MMKRPVSRSEAKDAKMLEDPDPGPEPGHSKAPEGEFEKIINEMEHRGIVSQIQKEAHKQWEWAALILPVLMK